MQSLCHVDGNSYRNGEGSRQTLMNGLLGEEEGTNKKMKEFEEGREWKTAMLLLLLPLSLVWSVRAHPWAAALVLSLLGAAEALLRQVQGYSQ